MAILFILGIYITFGTWLTIKTMDTKREIAEQCFDSAIGSNLWIFILCCITTFYWPLMVLIGSIMMKKEANN